MKYMIVLLVALSGCSEKIASTKRRNVVPVEIVISATFEGGGRPPTYVYTVRGCDPSYVVRILTDLKFDCEVGSNTAFQSNEPCLTIREGPMLFGERTTLAPDGSVEIVRRKDGNNHGSHDDAVMRVMQRLFFH